MRKEFTDITVVLDRSGSMASIRTDAEGGLNQFIDEQKQQPGEAIFTLVQFDTEYEFVHKAKPIKDVPKCMLVPRGMTALLDAVGKAIAETGERLEKMPEADRPGLVCFVIITDGQENSSKEYTKAQIKSMIEHQQGAYNWKFTFLGANQDAFAEAVSIGIQAGRVMCFLPQLVKHAFAAASSSVSRTRGAASRGVDAQLSYTDAEKKSVM